MTLNDFIVAANTRHPYQRVGQAAFNTLHAVRPDLAEQVRGSMIDPFYQDDRLPEFYTFVATNW